MHPPCGRKDVSSGAGREYGISPCQTPPGSTNQQAQRDLLGEHERKVVFLLLLVMKRRENPGFLEFIARVDVGCSAVEMAANWFSCDRQLRTIQEIPYKWTYFLNKRFESSNWVLNMSMWVYTDLISCLNSCIDLQVSRRVRKRKETVCGFQSRLCYWTVSMQFFW